MLENKYNDFYYKIKNDKSINENEFFRFYNLIKKYDHNLVSKIYPKKDYDKYMNILNNDSNYQQNIQGKNFYLEKIININPSFIQCFINLAQTNDFIESEKNLNISRQAIKKNISNIEKIFNSNLFEKKYSKYVLTNQGQDLYPYLIKIYSQIKKLEVLSKKSFYGTDYNEKNLVFGFTPYYLDIFYLKKTIDFFRKNIETQDFNFNSSSLSLDSIKEGIIKCKIDFGIISEIPHESFFDYIVLSETPYIIVSKPQPIKNYDEFNYIFPETTKDKSIMLMSKLVENNIKFRNNHITLCIKYAEEGNYCLFLPEIRVRKKIKEGKLAIVAKNPIKTTLKACVIWNKYVPLNNISIDFINMLKEIFKKTL